MSNLLLFPDRRKTMSEGALWLVRIGEGLTDDERRELEQWLASDPRNAQVLMRLANVSSTFDALSELANIFPIDQYRPPRPRPWLLKGAAVAVAAAVAAAWLGGLALLQADAPSTPTAIQVALPEVREAQAEGAVAGTPTAPQRSYQTEVGEQLSTRLPDGSVVTLNTNTQLDIDYSDSERSLTIRQGEASFNVASDAARPFRVRVGETVVQAVGTVFNVQLGVANRIEVTVSEGQVRVTSANVPTEAAAAASVAHGIDMTVTAGEWAVIGGLAEAVRPIDSLEIEAKLAWQQGMLIFRGAPLEEALADLSRYTTVKFTIADDSIRSRRVGGYFRTGDIDGLLVALRESFGIEPRRVGDEIILTAGE